MTFSRRGIGKGILILAVAIAAVFAYERALSAYLLQVCEEDGGLQRGPVPLVSGFYLRHEVEPNLHYGHVLDAITEGRFSYVETNRPLPGFTYFDAAAKSKVAEFAAGLVGPSGTYFRHFLAPAKDPQCLDPVAFVSSRTLMHQMMIRGVPPNLCLAGQRTEVLSSEFALVREQRADLAGLSTVEWNVLKAVQRSDAEIRAEWRGFNACLIGATITEAGRRRCLGGSRFGRQCPFGDREAVVDHLGEVMKAPLHPLLQGTRIVDVDRTQHLEANVVSAEVIDIEEYDEPRTLRETERLDFATPMAPDWDVAAYVDRLVIHRDGVVRRVRIHTREIRGAVLSNLRADEAGLTVLARTSVQPPWTLWLLEVSWDGEIRVAHKILMPDIVVERPAHAVVVGLTSHPDAYEFELLERFGPAQVSKAFRLRIPRRG